MTFDELEMLLAPYLVSEPDGTRTKATLRSGPLSAPLDNFFDDPLLLMIYHSEDTLPSDLKRTRALLHTVANEGQPTGERGHAALGIANIIIKNRKQGTANSTDSSVRWLELAMRWGNIVAHRDVANFRLAESELQTCDADDRILLPSVKPLNDRHAPNSLSPTPDVRNAWERGAHLALLASSASFNGWDKECLRAALTCVYHHVVYLPPSYGAEGKWLPHVKEVGGWVIPLLSLLAEALVAINPHDTRLLRLLERRQQAIRLLLEDRAGKFTGETTPSSSRKDEPRAESIVVIRGRIPPTSERGDSELLAKYEILRRPMALATMPSIAHIEEMAETLRTEFPWANDAIEVMFNELKARKRHGSNVLGMQPVLLVGPPGAGKTRLTQRLSDLLSIPSTVIGMASMGDARVLKGTARGWSSNRPSRILECIAATGPSHLFLLDEVDKAQSSSGNGGNAQEALLDLLEPGNARRYADEFLLAEADISHCLYVLTANSLRRIPAPLLSRVAISYVAPPGPEHSTTIATQMLRDIETAWRIPSGTLEISQEEMRNLIGLSPREMRRALMNILGSNHAAHRYTRH